ncbi:hypothetical protein RSM1_20885 [Methylobacterium radiotolerans]|nr:hypothetical protein RSM1_20885 [Methylobacterium radiotolerans]
MKPLCRVGQIPDLAEQLPQVGGNDLIPQAEFGQRPLQLVERVRELVAQLEQPLAARLDVRCTGAERLAARVRGGQICM